MYTVKKRGLHPMITVKTDKILLGKVFLYTKKSKMLIVG